MKLTTFLGLLILPLLPTSSQAAPPNVIVIMADDLGYQDLGYQGSESVKTPHIDALARTGVVFTDAHTAASVCSPSRAGFITGRYQQRFGHEGNCPRGKQGMDVNEYTIGQAFQSLGYQTYIVGKWHLGATEAMYPTQRGFHQFWGLREGSRSYFYGKQDKPGNPHAIEHNGKHVQFEGFLTDRMTDAAVRMIESDQKAPFFLFLSYTAPHGPLEATPEDLAKAKQNPYHALIQNLDDNIGRLLAYLDQKKLRDNTVIWFLSDNGGIVGSASNFPLNGRKGIEFEGGHRVPFILNWPAGIPKPQRFDGLTSAMDIFPTSFQLAGGKSTPKPLDGVDLLPFIRGTQKGSPHPTLYWRKLEQAAVRHGQWKLIRAEGLPPMLYNLESDLSELNEVAKQHPEKVQELQKMLTQWESGTVEPLWGEGKIWTKKRKQANIQFRDAKKIDAP